MNDISWIWFTTTVQAGKWDWKVFNPKVDAFVAAVTVSTSDKMHV